LAIFSTALCAKGQGNKILPLWALVPGFEINQVLKQDNLITVELFNQDLLVIVLLLNNLPSGKLLKEDKLLVPSYVIFLFQNKLKVLKRNNALIPSSVIVLFKVKFPLR
jgi:hypothetical protein